jgi:hypothetical protein
MPYHSGRHMHESHMSTPRGRRWSWGWLGLGLAGAGAGGWPVGGKPEAEPSPDFLAALQNKDGSPFLPPPWLAAAVVTAVGASCAHTAVRDGRRGVQSHPSVTLRLAGRGGAPFVCTFPCAIPRAGNHVGARARAGAGAAAGATTSTGDGRPASKILGGTSRARARRTARDTFRIAATDPGAYSTAAHREVEASTTSERCAP